MRRSKTQSMVEALDEYVKAMKFGGKLSEVGVVNSWESVVGKSISIHTKSINVRNGILYVQLDSSVVRNELLMLKQPLIQKLNEKAGSEVIKDIVLR